MGHDGAQPDWQQLSGFIAGTMGLHFPQERWADLQRGLAGAALEFGFTDIAACAKWLLAAPLSKDQIQLLAGHLTIGETYFFRDQKTFEVLSNRILPALIQSRRGTGRRLRFWSAACCSGEEAYSLAILLHQILPDLKEWKVTILATDINPHFLRKALIGSYGEWSFRNTPSDFRDRYFVKCANGQYSILPEIRSMVTFAPLNLAEDSYPSLATETNAMDLIFCRNVLMYFTPGQTERVVTNLHRSLIEGGWLAVSASESSQTLFARFATRNYPGVIFYQKSGDKLPTVTHPLPLPEKFSGTQPQPAVRVKKSEITIPVFSSHAQGQTTVRETPFPIAGRLFDEGRYADASDLLLASVDRHPHDPKLFSLLARALANQGQLGAALMWCDRWIAADKIDAAGHYLRAIVLLEQGDSTEARSSLQRATYLAPSFVLAHFVLGNLARGLGKAGESARHFANARELLATLKPDDFLPESDGITARRLTETIDTLNMVGSTS